MNDQDRFALIQRGKMADALFEALADRISARQKTVLSMLKQDFRAGADHVKLASGVAAYCALDDLVAELQRESKQGRSAAEEMRNASESGTST